MMERCCIAIDLKSFYASAECRRRGLDPMDTNLVVADEERSDRTICLAVSPPLKACGIPGRCRLFEVKERMRQINAAREAKAPGHRLEGYSVSASELSASPAAAADFLVAKPHMADYIALSTSIYGIYLRYIAPEDMHVYSIDEVFIEATDYLQLYSMTAEELARRMIQDVLAETGITATAGIGTNLYLAKIAMDIKAKRIDADSDGVRIASLDEMEYRRTLWTHRPLTDFWRIGSSTARKLEERRIYTMGDIARCSVEDEDVLYRLFGINAELLIDHAWGWEPCTMEDIKAYRPDSSSIGSGQVLQCGYETDKARLVVREMADAVASSLLARHLATDRITLSIGYDAGNMQRSGIFGGETKKDRYGRTVPRSARGSADLGCWTSSARKLMEAAAGLFDRIVDPSLLIRRLYIAAARVISEDEADSLRQGDLFESDGKDHDAEKERQLQEAALSIRRRFGGNALLRGMNLEEGSTARERNMQIGGHHR